VVVVADDGDDTVVVADGDDANAFVAAADGDDVVIVADDDDADAFFAADDAGVVAVADGDDADAFVEDANDGVGCAFADVGKWLFVFVAADGANSDVCVVASGAAFEFAVAAGCDATPSRVVTVAAAAAGNDDEADTLFFAVVGFSTCKVGDGDGVGDGDAKDDVDLAAGIPSTLCVAPPSEAAACTSDAEAFEHFRT
jgi:hypothetical protein